MTRGHYEIMLSVTRSEMETTTTTHGFSQVDFAVLREQNGKSRFLCKGASSIVFALEGGDLPLVNIVRVPPANKMLVLRNRRA